MPSDPDGALALLKQLKSEFAELVAARGDINEADTRANLIDKILIQVCGWPDADVHREVHTERGYMDYTLAIRGRPHIAVEAKREGKPFTLPVTTSKFLKLSGTLMTGQNVKEAINQVRGYCDDFGIRYAIATNGYAWVVFRAIREDMPWREGSARIFHSLENVESSFTEFWNLLSYDAIQAGSLDSEFGTTLRAPRKMYRVIDRLFNSELPLQRNRLHVQLHSLIQTIFQDIADQDPIEILESCYVHTASLKIVARDLDAIIVDSIPRFLRDQGAEPIKQSATDAGEFGDALASALTSKSGQLYLLLGGIGCGKTTFVKRFERETGKSLLESNRALLFHLDFLGAQIDPSTVEKNAWQDLLKQIRSHYASENYETRRNIKKAFIDNVQTLSQTIRAFAMQAGAFEKALSPYLEKWQSETSDYVPRLLRVIQKDRHARIILFIDNVDQLSPSYQAQVFLLAQRMTRSIDALTILSLREESYYTANLQRTFTAFTSRKFHIASPRFRKLIDSRIRYALDILEQSRGPVDYVLGGGVCIDRAAVAAFLRIIEKSIFERNMNIARFIEAICFGNMRQALDMFTLFMTSGATDVDKMLNIYERDGAYYVAFHEFVKSIMLGDRKYYKDHESSIMNLFDCGNERNASHFTCLRILRALSLRRSESSREGQGYLEISPLLSKSEDIFDNREDFVRSLNKLVMRQLIEVNTRSTESIAGASHVRITSSGWYYLFYLVKSFAYLDLVLQDTPLNDEATAHCLTELMKQVDNLDEGGGSKIDRTQVRFSRVRQFLDYLAEDETREDILYGLSIKGDVWREPFMPELRKQIELEIAWIERRLRENRERFEDDLTIEVAGGPGPAVADDEPDTEESGVQELSS
jgi:hypothetical protein